MNDERGGIHISGRSSKRMQVNSRERIDYVVVVGTTTRYLP